MCIITKGADGKTRDLRAFRCQFRAAKFAITMEMSFRGSNSKQNRQHKFELLGIDTCKMKIAKCQGDKINKREKNRARMPGDVFS